MSSQISRIGELRRRVEADPASLAFVQLAEELRREGADDEAVAVCRAGLAHHPHSLTARVTLGRALIELERYDEAFTELTEVLDVAPGNLAAVRALAEVYQRRGLNSEALVHYRRALQVTQHEANLEQAAPADDVFDFDTLLTKLGEPAGPPLPPAVLPPPGPVEAAPPAADDRDALAMVERLLREREAKSIIGARAPHDAAEERRMRILTELEGWLTAIVAAREPRPRP